MPWCVRVCRYRAQARLIIGRARRVSLTCLRSHTHTHTHTHSHTRTRTHAHSHTHAFVLLAPSFTLPCWKPLPGTQTQQAHTVCFERSACPACIPGLSAEHHLDKLIQLTWLALCYPALLATRLSDQALRDFDGSIAILKAGRIGVECALKHGSEKIRKHFRPIAHDFETALAITAMQKDPKSAVTAQRSMLAKAVRL